MDALYQDLVQQGINNVQIIAIGMEQYSNLNSNWTNGHTIPVVNDPDPNDTWNHWGASQRDLFFLDTNGNYSTHFNITVWNYDAIYDAIMNRDTTNMDKMLKDIKAECDKNLSGMTDGFHKMWEITLTDNSRIMKHGMLFFGLYLSPMYANHW